MSRLADELRPRRLGLVSRAREGLHDRAADREGGRRVGAVFKQLPRVDAVFVPGGDPGHTEPGVMFNLLARQTAALRTPSSARDDVDVAARLHRHWMETFYGLMAKQPAWLTGIVIGPQNRDSIATVRAAHPGAVPHPPLSRHHPHHPRRVPRARLGPRTRPHARTRADQPAAARPGGDLPQVGRHGTRLHHLFRRQQRRCQQDRLECAGLEPGGRCREVLREYGRYFVGPDLATRVADGLAAASRRTGRVHSRPTSASTRRSRTSRPSRATPRRTIC